MDSDPADSDWLDPARAAAPNGRARSARVDAEWYLRRYPDVSATDLSAQAHYRTYGHHMGRDPAAGISTGFLRGVLASRKGSEPVAAALSGRYSLRVDRVLTQASILLRQGRPGLAADHARRLLPPDLASAWHLFAASKLVMPDLDHAGQPIGSLLSPGTRTAWCTHVNEWLAGYGLSPVTVSTVPVPGRSVTAPDGRVPLIAFLGSAARPVQIDTGRLISVIMTCHNDAGTVVAAARSILDQSWRDLELLVVDDASTDGTHALLAELAASDPRMRLWQNVAGAGPFVSRNIAVSQANGAYLTLHHAQDWALPERLERQVSAMVEGGLVASLVVPVRIDAQGRFWHPDQTCQTIPADDNLPEASVPMIQATIFHQSLGFWDGVSRGGDEEMMARLELLTKKLPVLPLPLILRHDPVSPAAGIALDQADPDARVELDEYRAAFTAFHRELDPTTARFGFPGGRRFPIPEGLIERVDRVSAIVQDHLARGMRLTRDIDVDVAIVTNLRFPGGNASSTLDELRVLRQYGLRCALIHCPVDLPVIRATSERYRPHDDIIVEWPRVGSLRARCLIVRHPRVVVSSMFQKIIGRLSADFGFVVVNNSHLRPTGRPVYDIGTFSRIARQLPVEKLEICPISEALRAELVTWRDNSGEPMPLSSQDWTPTLNPEAYCLPPRLQMEQPFTIGRHGRDGDEKWHESSGVLAQVYPASDRYRVLILGGVEVARKRMGGLPANWTVHEFGEIEVRDYLAQLDAFVYYPRTTLVEGFGRTIGEAMMAGVPCIVSPTIERNFGPLAFYPTPGAVQPLMEMLARDNTGRVAFLRKVQEIAVARFSSGAVNQRLAVTGLFQGGPAGPRVELSPDMLAWRADILAAAERAAPGAA